MLLEEMARADQKSEQTMRFTAKVNSIESASNYIDRKQRVRLHIEGADACYRDLIVLNTDNLQLDDEVLLLAIPRKQADELWNDIGRVAEIVENDFSVEDARRLWAHAEMLKPDEPVPFLQERTVAA